MGYFDVGTLTLNGDGVSSPSADTTAPPDYVAGQGSSPVRANTDSGFASSISDIVSGIGTGFAGYNQIQQTLKNQKPNNGQKQPVAPVVTANTNVKYAIYGGVALIALLIVYKLARK